MSDYFFEALTDLELFFVESHLRFRLGSSVDSSAGGPDLITLKQAADGFGNCSMHVCSTSTVNHFF